MTVVDVAEARVNARRDRILERLGRDGRVEVGDLAVELTVTEETIRRDLRSLENHRLLRRTHGGAVSVAAGESMARLRPAEWEPMAAAAADLVSDAPAVYLGPGPVCEMVAALLAQRPGIQLIAGSTSVALTAVLANPDAKVHTIGGAVQADGSLSGMWARDQLAGLEVDFSVIETDGFTPDGYFLASDPEGAAALSAALTAARAAVVLVKGGSPAGPGYVKYARLSDVDHVVASAGVPEGDLDRLQDANLDVLVIGSDVKS